MRVAVTRRGGWRFVAVLAALAFSSTALCDEVADARRAFVSGMKHFDLGEYGQALDDFKNGYRAKEDPVFLYNIAQCYRMMKQNGDAIRYYRLYLSRAPDASNRAEIEERIVKLQELVDREPQKQPATPPPAPTQPPAALQSTPTTTVVATPAAPAKTPVYKKWWLWTLVGVAAVGAGVGLGVGLTRSSTPSGTTFPTAGF